MLNENKMNQFMQQIMNERDAKEKALGFSQTTSEMRSILKSIVETPEKDIVDVLETERKEIVFECDRKLRLVSDILSDENVMFTISMCSLCLKEIDAESALNSPSSIPGFV